MNMLTPSDDGARGPLDPVHPSPSQWLGWLYDECPRREQARLERHLEACAECRGRVNRWRAVMRDLNIGALPKSQPTLTGWMPALKWAAAALLVLGIGFGLGWLVHSPDREFAAWRRQLQAEWRADFRQAAARLQTDLEISRKTAVDELANRVLDDSRQSLEQYLRQFARGYESLRQTESGLLWTRLQALEDRRADDYSALRKDLETLAVTAQGEFWKTRRQLGGLIELAENKGGHEENPRLPR